MLASLVLHHNSQLPPWQPQQCQAEAANTATQIVDVTFVDDAAFLIAACSPELLDNKISATIDIVYTVFAMFGLKVNFNKGKTEIIIRYRGKGSALAKANLSATASNAPTHIHCIPHVAVKTKSTRTVHVCSVDSYKHLGSVICKNNSYVPEANRRAQAANHTHIQLSLVVPSNKAISFERRKQLARALILSKLLYNVHNWSSFCGRARAVINNMYMKVWRNITNSKRFDAHSKSDAFVRALAGVPSLDCLIRQRRLAYIARVSRSQLSPLIAMSSYVSSSGAMSDYSKLIRDDLVVLQAFLPSRLAHVDSLQIHNIMMNYPKEWKSIVKMYSTPLDDSSTALRTGTVCSVPVLESHPIVSLPSPLPSSDAFGCTLCNVSFTSKKALDQHCRIKHHSRSEVALRLPDISVCPVCFTNFNNRARLLVHLSETRIRSKVRATNCKIEFLKLPQYQLRVCTDEASKIQIEQRDLIKKARDLGHSHVIASVPSKRGSCSVLKGSRWKPRHLLRRISGKSSISYLKNKYPSKSNSLAIIANDRHMSKIEFGRIQGGIGVLANITPITTFSRPPKYRRIGMKSLGAADMVSSL